MATITPTPSSAGFKVYKIGATTPGMDFLTIHDFCRNTYTEHATDISSIICGEVYDQGAFTNDVFEVAGGAANASFYYLVRPVPGLDFRSSPDSDPVSYGSTGLELVLDTSKGQDIQSGIVFENFRIHVIGSSTSAGPALRWNTSYNGNIPGTLRKNKIFVDCMAANAFSVGSNYSQANITDNLIIFSETSPSALYLNSSAVVNDLRNTVVRLGVAGCYSNGNQYGTKADNAFQNMQGPAYVGFASSGGSASYTNNISDNAADARTGFTVVSSSSMFAGTSDYRPKTGGTLINTASASAANTSDMFGRNRGSNPNAGAIQFDFAPGIPQGVITNQPNPDGQNLGPITYSLTNNPTSSTAVAIPSASNPNGAQRISGVVTLGSGSASAQFTGITPGTYDLVIKAANANGEGTVSGTQSFMIVGVSGNPQAPDPVDGSTPPPATFSAKISIPLTLISGGAAANLSNLKWAWHDQATPDLFIGAPTDKGNTETTDGTGVIVIYLPNSTKTASGQVGHIEITNSDGNPANPYSAFVGPWAVD